MNKNFKKAWNRFWGNGAKGQQERRPGSKPATQIPNTTQVQSDYFDNSPASNSSQYKKIETQKHLDFQIQNSFSTYNRVINPIMDEFEDWMRNTRYSKWFTTPGSLKFQR